MRHHYTFLVLCTLSSLSKSQRPSPCPEIFHYESQNRDEDNKWYGSIKLSTNEDLFGIWVKILLDHKAELLGNWFGASTSSDNKEFTIKSTNYHLKAGSPVQLRFYIQYDVNQPVPSVSSIKLNGKYVCNVNDSHTNNNRPNTKPNSNSRPSNTRPQQQNGGNSNTQSQNRPLNVDTDSYHVDQSDFNPAFGNSRPNENKPSNTQSNTRPQNSVSNARPSSQSSNSNTRPNYNEYDTASSGGTNRPVQSSNSNTRPNYNEYDTVSGTSNRPVQSSNTNTRPNYNEYDTVSGTSNRPVQSSNTNNRPSYQNEYDTGSSGSSSSGSSSNKPVSGSNVNRPLNFDADSYGTNQNEFAPAFGSVGDNNPYNQGSNNRLPTDNYNTNRPVTSTNTINLGSSTIQRPSQNTNSDADYYPGDGSILRPVARPETSRPSILNKKPACGTVFKQPTPLITHGLESSEGQYPWHVALYHSQGIQLTYICGGSLISEDYVVTAAHCVTSPSTGLAINPQNILVYLGKTNLKKFGTGVQDIDVSKIIVHRDYNHTVFHNDIALLKLGHSADITNYVRPVCLWESTTNLNSVLNQLGTVVGWGFDENGQLTTSLMQTKMPVVEPTTCIYSNPDFFSRFTFDKSYCAGFRNGTTVCNGDSGGGMVFPKTKRNGEVISWQLRGLVSVGVALQGKTSCDPSHYIVFTDVAKHLDWIRNNINNGNY